MRSLFRRRLLVHRLGAVAVVAGVAAAVALSTTASSVRAATCTRSMTLYIIAYQFYPKLSTLSTPPNGCWTYDRLNPEQNSAFMLCSPNPSTGTLTYTGTGSRRIYSDTNPYSWTETQQVTWLGDCATAQNGPGSIDAEYMAAKDTSKSGSASNYCANHGDQVPCWELLNNGVSVARHFAELYTSDGDIDSLYSNWANGGYGANPSNSRPVINIFPVGTQPEMVQYIDKIANATGSGGYISIYVPGANYGTLDPNAPIWVNSAMNSWTTG